MPEMVPYDGAALEATNRLLGNVSFASNLHHGVKPETMDPIPPVNAKGGRTIPADGWRTIYSLVVTEDMCNPLGNLHGGAAATLVDTVTSASMGLLATDKMWGHPMLTGVSLALDMAYYNACPVGTKMKITVTVEHLGASLANVRGELTDWETGKRYAAGNHVKTWRGPKPKL